MTIDKDSIDRADHLAALLSDERGAQILAAVQKVARARTPATAPVASSPEDRRVGVWEAVPGPAGCELIARTADPQTGRLWADVERVPGKAGARRVAVVGESTARGYLLDPVVTPTGVLQQQLDHMAGAGSYQCVDLARTGAGVLDLARVVSALPQLEVDVLVLLAGNNWSLQQLSLTDGDLLADALAEGGVAGLRAVFEDRIVRPTVAALLRRVQSVARSGGMQVVVVVPEFNLVEWTPEETWSVGVLPGERSTEWHRLGALARAEIGKRHWQRAIELCDRMAELDDGSSPEPGRLRGLALTALGDHAGARRSWEASRDAVTGQLLAHTPRVTARLQETLRRFAAENEYGLVDLRRELAAPDSGLPDPAHFLDYCHLSTAGMTVLAHAVAEQVVAGAPPASENSRQSLPSVPAGGSRSGAPATAAAPEQEAVGHLLAACHNAWHGQPEETLRRHISAALRLGGGREPAESLLGWLTTSIPGWATGRFSDLCYFPHAERYLSPNAVRAPLTLARTALPRVLAELLAVPMPQGAAGTADEQHDVIDLLAGRRDDAAELSQAARSSFFRSATPVFRAGFRAKAPGRCRLDLHYRTPHPARTPVLGRLEVNGQFAAPLPPSRTWTKVTVTADARDLNSVAVRWPSAEQSESAWREESVHALRTGRSPVMLPVFGEIFRAQVRL
ncbi:hypothetical protein [Kitasatospora sp. NPDC059571]|uniref:hypothetical protein n=1 Tax=Kitasatospora sp. NPDC059571 TaxID=3346871 RepID=UPI00369D3181